MNKITLFVVLVLFGILLRLASAAPVATGPESQGDVLLVGYGLVGGLRGKGDSDSREIRQMVSNFCMSRSLPLNEKAIEGKNMAMVIVTARVNPGMKSGELCDVKVSSLSDARSLWGGTLFPVILIGPDKIPYATAEGDMVWDRIEFVKKHPTVCEIPAGATLKRDVSF